MHVYMYLYILRPHSRVTGNFVASSRSPKSQKTGVSNRIS